MRCLSSHYIEKPFAEQLETEVNSRAYARNWVFNNKFTLQLRIPIVSVYRICCIFMTDNRAAQIEYCNTRSIWTSDWNFVVLYDEFRFCLCAMQEYVEYVKI